MLTRIDSQQVTPFPNIEVPNFRIAICTNDYSLFKMKNPYATCHKGDIFESQWEAIKRKRYAAMKGYPDVSYFEQTVISSWSWFKLLQFRETYCLKREKSSRTIGMWLAV